jgi:hypothetical protein
MRIEELLMVSLSNHEQRLPSPFAGLRMRIEELLMVSLSNYEQHRPHPSTGSG